jgi:hypothetical protein
MFVLQMIYGYEDLSDLIGFGFALAILNVDPRVPGPGHLIDSVATSMLPRLAKIMLTDSAEIIEPNIRRTLPHRLKNPSNRSSHYNINIDTIVKS